MPKPSGDKPLKYRELRKKLRKFGVQEFRKRGKVVREYSTIHWDGPPPEKTMRLGVGFRKRAHFLCT